MVIVTVLMRSLNFRDTMGYMKWNGAVNNIPFHLNLDNIVSQLLKPIFPIKKK